MANIELLDKIITQIEEHPELWNQGVWAAPTECGTAYCVAGWAASMTLAGPLELHGSMFIDADGVRHVWATYGADVLGITDSQADELFNGGNDLETIKEMRDALAANPGADLYRECREYREYDDGIEVD
ncbi:MAG: hypothetical protein ABW046_22465 [Actinoplanes sp.]